MNEKHGTLFNESATKIKWQNLISGLDEMTKEKQQVQAHTYKMHKSRLQLNGIFHN